MRVRTFILPITRGHTFVMGKMKVCTLIMGKMKVHTFIMGKMRVRIKLFMFTLRLFQIKPKFQLGGDHIQGDIQFNNIDEIKMQNSKLSFKKFKPLHDKSRTSGVLQAIYLFLVPKFKCKGNINLDPLPPPINMVQNCLTK